jgi:hypothetical protein
MPLDTNLLYGIMAGSFLGHMAIPAGIAVLFSFITVQDNRTRGIILLVGTVLLSFLFQAGFLTSLQASACTGIKDYGSIFAGASIAALITAVLVAIPIFVEPMRLAISQLFGEHKSLLTSEQKKVDEALIEAGQEVVGVMNPEGLPKQTGGALTSEDYDKQVRRELTIGASYWAAFAGAYGIGVGSLIAAKCPATS